jgi:hypothetical protein
MISAKQRARIFTRWEKSFEKSKDSGDVIRVSPFPKFAFSQTKKKAVETNELYNITGSKETIDLLISQVLSKRKIVEILPLRSPIPKGCTLVLPYPQMPKSLCSRS